MSFHFFFQLKVTENCAKKTCARFVGCAPVCDPTRNKLRNKNFGPQISPKFTSSFLVDRRSQSTQCLGSGFALRVLQLFLAWSIGE